MKSILIIDTPDKCEECPLIYWTISGWACKPTKSMIDEDVKPNWCPLKHLPQKKNGDDLYERYGSWTPSDEKEVYYRVGFNDCLDEITGEVE